MQTFSQNKQPLTTQLHKMKLLQRKISPAFCLLMEALPFVFFLIQLVCIVLFVIKGCDNTAHNSEIVLPAFGAYAANKIRRSLSKKNN